MGRVLRLGVVLGLVGGLLSAPSPASGQTTAITLSYINLLGNTPISSIAEGHSSFAAAVQVSVASPVSAAVTVRVTLGASGTTATKGTCSSSGFIIALWSCTNDWGDTTNASTVDVTIASGATSGQTGVQLLVVDDTVTEGPEIIRLSGTAPSGYSVGTFDITVDDGDDGLSLSVDPGFVAEGAGARPVTVSARFGGATSALAAATEVTVTVAGGTATLGAAGDFTVSGLTNNRFTLSIPARSVSSGSGSFTLTAREDNMVEAAGAGETVSLSAAATVGGSAVSGSGTLRIYDAGEVVTLSLVKPSNTAAEISEVGEDEGAQTLRVKATLGASDTSAITVNVTMGAAGSTAARGAAGDYTLSASTTSVTINAGETEGFSPDFTFTTFSDRVTEEHVRVLFTGTATGHRVAAAGLQITDQDRVLRLTAAGNETDPKKTALTRIENHRHENFWVYVRGDLGGVSDGVFTASTGNTYGSQLEAVFKFHDGTASGMDGSSAILGNDWASDHHTSNITNSGRITIPAGGLGADVFAVANSKNLVVNIANDSVAEGDEVFYAGLKANPAGFTHLRVPITILDDDTRVALTIDADSGEDGNQTMLTEGDDGSGVTVSGRLSGASSVIGSATEVTVSATGAASPSAGQAGTDDLSYAPSSPNTITFPARSLTSGTATLAGLTITDDDVVEDAETFRVGVSSVLGSNGGATMTIVDNDTDITLSVDKGAVEEGAGAESVTVSARFAGSSSTMSSATDVSVALAGAGGAVAGDFTASGSGVSNNAFTIRIPAGSLEGSRTISLTAVSDTDSSEAGEGVAVSGSATVGGRSVDVTGTQVEIIDAGGLITLGFEDAGGSALTGVGEDGGAQTVRVTASVASAPASSVSVAVNVGAAGGTATLGPAGDYTRGAGTVAVTISGGSTSGGADVVITPRSDTITEDHETIRFTGSAAGYTVRSASLPIMDGDRTIRLTGPNVQGLEGEAKGASGNNIFRADLGSGESRDAFVASTSSTYSNAIRPRLHARPKTASWSDFQFSTGTGRFIQINSGVVSSNRIVDNQGGYASNIRVAFHMPYHTDTVAEGNKTLEIYFGVPAGFTGLAQEFVLLDDGDDDISLSVDTSGDSGVQTTLAEGADGSGVTVSASFPSATTSSAIPVDTVVELSAAGAVAPAAGEAGMDDLSYAPSSPNTITFPARSLTPSGTATLTGLSIADDEVVEGPETFTVGGSSALGTAAGATITIADDDADITLSVSPGAVAEGAGATSVEVTARFAGSSSVLTTDTDVAVTLAAAATGGATPGTDFTATGTGVTNDSRFTITIPARSVTGSKTIRITAPDDSDNTEDSETVTVGGSAMVGGSAVTVTGTEILVVDPDRAITLTTHSAETGGTALPAVREEGGEQTVWVRAAAGGAVSSDTVVTVTVGAVGGTAVLGAAGDYVRSAETVEVTITSGNTVGAAEVKITPRNDGTAEGPETIRLSGVATGYVVVGASLEIRETITLTLTGGAVGEGDADGDAGAVSVTAAFAGASSSDLAGATEVTLSFAAGANTEADDFTAGTAVVLSIPAGSTSSNAAALSGLTIKGDDIAEGAESIAVGGSATGFSVTGATLEITDDDLDVTLTADTDSATTTVFEDELSEGETPAVQVRAAFTSATSNDLSAGLAVSVTAGEASPQSARGGGVDFTAPGSSVTVTIPAGSSTTLMSGWASLTGLGVEDDKVTEDAETFWVTGTVPGGVVAPDTLTIAASDNELEVSVSPGVVVEQAAAHPITVVAGFAGASSSALASATTVNVTVAAGDTNGATMAASCPPTTEDACADAAMFDIVIPAGQVSESGTFNLSARDDNDAEMGGETVKVTGTEMGASNSDSDTVLLVDDGIEVAFLNPADDTALASLGEGDGTVQVRVRVTMPASDTARRVVGLNIAGGTATEDDGDGSFAIREDFRVSGLATPSGTPDGHELGVEVAAGQTTGTADFNIIINDDNVDEEDKTILASGGDVGSLPVAGTSLTITDNDAPPTNIDLAVSFAKPDGTPLTNVREDGSNTTGGATKVEVRASYQGDAVLPRGTTVPITVGKATGEATPGTDYQTVAGFNVLIPAYQSRGSTVFDLIIGNAENDDDPEGPETVTIVAGVVTGFTVPDTSFEIIDDDVTITLQLLDASAQPPTGLTEIREGESKSVTVRASYPGAVTLSEAHTIRIGVGGGTASASDYRATFPADPFEITIGAGDGSADGTFTLAVNGANDDNIAEGDETLQVTGALDALDVIPAALTIIDNDNPPTRIEMVASSSSRQVPEGQTARVTVRFPTGYAALPTATPVAIATSGSTAASSDYTISPRNVSIPAGGTQVVFTVSIIDDTSQESNETIRLTARTDDYGNAVLTLTIPANDQRDPDPAPGGGGGGGGAPPPSGGGGGGGAPPPAGPPAGPPAPPPPPAEPACQGRFCDEDGSVHQTNIEQIAIWEITLGCDADDPTKFCPSAQITRRQMAAFLYRAVNRLGPIPPPAGIEITDVPTDAWYRTFADWVVSTGAFAAPDGEFNPGGVVTRADMAVMMIASFPNINAVDEPEGLFNDVAGVDPAVVRAVEGMYHTGVTKGCSTTPLNYCPNQPVTRAQMASFFVRAVNYTPAPDTG